jgi:hypothetical protein
VVSETISGTVVSRKLENRVILWVIYPFCLMFSLVGAYFLVRTIAGFSTASATANWPKAEATITECEFKSHRHSEGTNYEVVVEYEYTVFGKKYENDKIHPNYALSSRRASHRMLYERLERSTVVMTRYDPSDPSDSYLVTDFLSSHLGEFFGGLFMVISGILGLVFFHFYTTGPKGSTSALEVVK